MRRMVIHRYILLSCVLLTVLLKGATAWDDDAEPSQPEHGNFPRFFDVFSRPKPEAEKETNVGLKHHLGNVFQGGSIGFQAEFNPVKKFHGIIDHAKKFIPFPDLLPVKPSDEDDEIIIPEKKPEDHGNVESEEDWMPQDPKVGSKPDGPKWEDIGEEDGGVPLEDYETEGIEDIIHPRRRPKRFIESKVYHVPLEFLSNAKPVEVKVRENDV